MQEALGVAPRASCFYAMNKALPRSRLLKSQSMPGSAWNKQRLNKSSVSSDFHWRPGVCCAGQSSVDVRGSQRSPDGRVAHARFSGFHVPGQLPPELWIGVDRQGKVVPAERFVQLADKCRAVERVHNSAVCFAGVSVDDTHFLCV